MKEESVPEFLASAGREFKKLAPPEKLPEEEWESILATYRRRSSSKLQKRPGILARAIARIREANAGVLSVSGALAALVLLAIFRVGSWVHRDIDWRVSTNALPVGSHEIVMLSPPPHSSLPPQTTIGRIGVQTSRRYRAVSSIKAGVSDPKTPGFEIVWDTGIRTLEIVRGPESRQVFNFVHALPDARIASATNVDVVAIVEFDENRTIIGLTLSRKEATQPEEYDLQPVFGNP